MTGPNNKLPSALSKFFTTYLSREMNVSGNTIFSYRDSFVILFEFFKVEKRIKPHLLKIEDLSLENIRSFLLWLEEIKGYAHSSINSRLAAIKSFFRFLELEDPAYFEQAVRVRALRSKKTSRKRIHYLTVEQVETLIQQPDPSTKKGRRDMLIISLLFSTGARVSELLGMTSSAFRFDDWPSVQVIGKGGYHRSIPIHQAEAKKVKEYFQEHRLDQPEARDYPLFMGPSGKALSRVAVFEIIKKYAVMAKLKNDSYPKKITCHTLRHSKAMDMVTKGIDIISIRDFLGHRSIQTTYVYTSADSQYRTEAINSAYTDLYPEEKPRWTGNPSVMEFLKGI